MKDEFVNRLNKVLKYGADHSTVENLLSQLSAPEHLLTRTGHPSRSDFRGVLSDALRDHGRDKEADLLQSGRHVVVHEGQVKPGRFTWQHLQEAMRQVDTSLFHPTVMPPGPYRTTAEWGPSLKWTPNENVSYRAAEERLYQPHLDDANREVVHHEDGVPHVGCTDDTCDTDDVPITETAKTWLDNSLKWQIRAASDGHREATGVALTEDQMKALYNHPLVKQVLNTPIEEPVPEQEAQ
jgi:hypothetical protein